MIIVSGKTFNHRPLLSRLGGDFNRDKKVWIFLHLAAGDIIMLRQQVGILVTVLKERPPRAPVWGKPFRDRPTASNVPIIVGDDTTYFNYFADQDPIAYLGFSSLGAFVDHVAALERPDNGGGLCDIGWTAEPGYAGTDSLAHALHIARTGWTDGLGMADRLLPPEPTAKRRRRSMTGGTVNVGRMLAGMPDHMVKRDHVKGRRIITVFVETVMWAGIKANTAIIRVILIAAMIDRLEQEGYSCNLVAVYSAKRRLDYKPYQTVVRIKDAGERLSIADVSFAFGHPSFGRRLVYASEGCLRQCNLNRDIRGHISQAFTEDHPPRANEFYIPQIFHNISDIWEMLEYIQPDNLPVKLKGDQ